MKQLLRTTFHVLAISLSALGASADKDGDILDPDNGSIYRCKLRLEDSGRRLKVRGFIGFSVFGRTQTWERAQ